MTKRAELTTHKRLCDDLFTSSVYGLSQAEKITLLQRLLVALHHHHCRQSQHYGNLFKGLQVDDSTPIERLPYLAVRLFKQVLLSSVGNDDIYRVLQSSGTSGHQPSRVVLDRETSARQSKVLVKVLQEWVGKQRLPMLIIDSPTVVQRTQNFNARAAGIQGLSFFGRDHTYALTEDMQPDLEAIASFAAKYKDQPVLMFGFTFMVWGCLIKALQASGKRYDFSKGILLHSGGWKKLEQEKVDNATFKSEVAKQLGISRIHNFYGMAEQVGAIFVECEKGFLHPPIFADVIIRDPFTLHPLANGKTGLVQVLSMVPSSYPGHSILTEDVGQCIGVDSCLCGRNGKYFLVQGRLPKTEIRGCSDTHGGINAN